MSESRPNPEALAERPWRIITYDKDATPEDVASLDCALEALSASGTVALPPDAEVRVQEPR